MQRVLALLRRVPLHPPLVASLPVLVLWALNRDEVASPDGVAVLWPVVVGSLVATAVLVLLLRSLRRGALLASLVAFLALVHGHLGGNDLVPWLGLLLVVGVLVWIGRAIVALSDGAAGVVTAIANVVAVTCVVAAVVPLAAAGRAPTTPATPTTSTPPVVDGVQTGGVDTLRDIVYIVPDRYGAADSLQEHLGVDNTSFVRFLEERGFAVAEDATANYPTTALALAATLRMDYLDDVAAAVPADARGDVAPLRALLRDHRVGQVLTEAGYEYVHVGSWWDPTATADRADRVLNYETRSEFAATFASTTILPTLQSALAMEQQPPTWRELRLANARWQLDQLDRLVRERSDRPRFVLVHLTLPHEPYVLDEDGSAVDGTTEAARSRDENYRRQLTYLNQRLRDMVDVLVDQPEATAPVVVLQADEGPHPLRKERGEGSSFDWATASDDELEVKLRILSAIRLPGHDVEALVPDDLSAVNTFRIVLGAVLDAELPLLEDRVLVHRTSADLYSHSDVTDRVRDPDS